MATRLALFSLLALLVAGCGEEPPPETAAGEEVSLPTQAVTVWSPEAEVFFEHPLLVAGRESGAWAIHVTQLDGFRPVTEGTLTLRFRRPDGAAYVHTANAPSRPGIFAPQPTIPEAGTFRLFMIVESPQVRDTLEIGDVTVYESVDAVPTPPSTEAEITYLKEQQWETTFGIATVQERTIQRSIEAPGTIEPVPGQFAKVSAPVSGLTPARANLNMPGPGDRVREGETLAMLSPSGGRGSYPELKGRVERLQREVNRAERLVEAEAIPQKRLVEARHDLELARAAFQSMGGVSGTAAPELTSTSIEKSDGASDFNYQLRSPISGRIQERHLAPGSRVEVGAVLYTIVDPSRVWIRLRVPAEHASAASLATGAVFTVEGSDTTYEASRVVSANAALDTDTRTLPVRLEAANPNGELKIGMMADARLLLEETKTGVAIPNDAIQIEDGAPVAYVETGGESFERRLLELGPTDGRYTLVERGVSTGEHVVTAGAYQVYLASLNTGQIGHGHTH